MTDAPDLTPEQDAVRRLLADARHDGSTPPEVVAGLDDTLAALVADRGDAPLADPDGHRTPATVVDLGTRRRRTAGIALLAAAAVVVGGVAIGQVLPRMSASDSDAGSAAGGDVTTSETRDFGGQEDSGGGSDAGSGDAEMGPESLKSTAPDVAYPTLSSFAADLEGDLLDLRATESARAVEPGAADAEGDCYVRGIGRGRRIVAQVDGQVGLVVFRRPDGAAQQAELYICGNPEPVRTLTLPAP